MRTVWIWSLFTSRFSLHIITRVSPLLGLERYLTHILKAETGQLDNADVTTQGEVLDNEQSQVQVGTITKSF